MKDAQQNFFSVQKTSRNFFDAMEFWSGAAFFFGFPFFTTLGALFCIQSVHHNFPLTIVACLFAFWCAFVCLDSIRFILAGLRQGIERFDVNLVSVRLRYFRSLEYLLALWWSFIFLMCIVWAVVFAYYASSANILERLITLIVSTGFAYASFLFLLVSLCYWGFSDDQVRSFTKWRIKYSSIHAIVIMIVAFLLPHLVKDLQ